MRLFDEILSRFPQAQRETLDKTARLISERAITGYMREAPGESPWRDETDTGPLRILHDHPLVEHFDVDPGRLKRSIEYKGAESIPDEQVFRIETDASGSDLEFGSRVPYADWEYSPEFAYLRPALTDIEPQIAGLLEIELQKIIDADDTEVVVDVTI